jgi:hypothetical protein
MWRMLRGEGQSSHCAIALKAEGATVVWFVNDRPVGFREFVDCGEAIRWSAQIRDQNWSAGWRMLPEYDERRGSPHRLLRNRSRLDEQ